VTRDGAQDFDFLHGRWRIDHRRLKERLAGCEEWEEFTTRMECRPILGGAGIDPGVTGRFTDGVGEFFGPDTHEGTPVEVRYTWSGITPAAARWAQAFSTDDGRAWETNWIMKLTRT
jgi:hypothetical protein